MLSPLPSLPCTCTLYPLVAATTMAHGNSKRFARFKPRESKRLTCSLEKMSSGANYVHAQCAPVVRFLYSVVMPLS